MNNICADPNINAIVKTGDGNSYIFRGDSYWKLTADSVAPGYPRKIAQDWPGLPSNLDAGFTWAKTKAIYFFKGGNYWKFDPERKPHVREDIYPKKISSWD